MDLIIIAEKNPFFTNSASSNRLLSLLSGLSLLPVNLELIIFGGKTSADEVDVYATYLPDFNVKITYLNDFINIGYWESRFYNYIGSLIFESRDIRRFMTILSGRSSIVWLDTSIFSFKLALKLKKFRPDIKLYIEMSEFLDIHMFNKGNYLQRLKGEYRRLLFENRSFYVINGVGLMTKVLLDYFQSKPNSCSKFIHLPMTVDQSRFVKAFDLLDEFSLPYIAFIGVMNDSKEGVSLLIKAFNSIALNFPKHKLYLVGGWNYDTPIHLRLIKEFGLEGRVFWMNEYPRDQIPNIICNADLLVLPRPDSKQARGGFPTKLGEYLATGNPVCATCVGEIPNYLVDNESVFFAEPGSIESFADAMQRTLNDRENARRVGLNGRKVAEFEFNKDIQARKLYDFLKQL